MLVALSAFTLSAMLTPLVLAAWVATLAQPMAKRFERTFGGRERISAMLTVALVLSVLIPLAFTLVSLGAAAIELVAKVRQSHELNDALTSIVQQNDSAGDAGMLLSPAKALELARSYGSGAWKTLASVAGAGAHAIFAGLIFIIALYEFLTNGDELWAWGKAHMPLSSTHADRFAAAFHETGRGLVVGLGLTALTQGVIATVTYAILGVPRALVLGVLTFFAAFIPSVGTTLVWLPVAVGLALTGHRGQAIAMAVIGLGVIGTVDNFLRPYLAKKANLRLSVFTLLLAMFGGFAVMGSAGLLFGPLVVRLAREALEITKDEGLTYLQ